MNIITDPGLITVQQEPLPFTVDLQTGDERSLGVLGPENAITLTDEPLRLPVRFAGALRRSVSNPDTLAEIRFTRSGSKLATSMEYSMRWTSMLIHAGCMRGNN